MPDSPLFRKVTILAVDDQPANLVALDAVFGTDYHLIKANSGAEAISLMKKNQSIDVILMDLQMPGMDGFETAAHIKRIDGCREVPIIFITAVYREDPYVKKGYEVGGIDYFTKPFDPEILKMKVAIYASFRHRTDLLRERERQIAETEELLKAGRKLSSILEGLPVGVIIADVEGRVCQTNEVVSRIFKAVDPIAHDCYGKILGWWDSSGQWIKDQGGPLSRALIDGEVSHGEVIEIRCLDGSETTILGSASPLLGIDRRIVGAVVVIQDVTEPKKIEADLERRVANLVSIGVQLEQSVANSKES